MTRSSAVASNRSQNGTTASSRSLNCVPKFVTT